jgi:hypothetical protein
VTPHLRLMYKTIKKDIQTLYYRHLQISSWKVCPCVTMFRHHFLNLIIETEELFTCILSSTTCRLLYQSNEQSDFPLGLAKYSITIQPIEVSLVLMFNKADWRNRVTFNRQHIGHCGDRTSFQLCLMWNSCGGGDNPNLNI